MAVKGKGLKMLTREYRHRVGISETGESVYCEFSCEGQQPRFVFVGANEIYRLRRWVSLQGDVPAFCRLRAIADLEQLEAKVENRFYVPFHVDRELERERRLKATYCAVFAGVILALLFVVFS